MIITLIKIGMPVVILMSLVVSVLLYVRGSDYMTRIGISYNSTQNLFGQFSSIQRKEVTKLCPEYPSSLMGPLLLPNTSKVTSCSEGNDPELDPGGKYAPKRCKARFRVAIIIPYRSRECQLHTLLSHMHPIWKRQEMDYQVYVINQVDGSLFNKGKLLNVGVAEATRDHQYDCYVFQNVDLLLEDDRCLYWCHPNNSHHLARYMDKFSYQKLAYKGYCSFNGKDIRANNIEYSGGVLMAPKTLFNGINGFSNMYWGWGAEDDDFYVRLQNGNYTITNPYDRKCSFHVIKHEHESTNAANPSRFHLLRMAHTRLVVDGYNNLKYRVIKRQAMHLYTNVSVDVGGPSEKLAKFMKSCTRKCDPVVPLD